MANSNDVPAPLSEIFIKVKEEPGSPVKDIADNVSVTNLFLKSNMIHPGPSSIPEETNEQEKTPLSLLTENEPASADCHTEDDQLSSEDDNNSCDESYAAFNVEAQLGNLSDSSGHQRENYSTEPDDTLDFIASDQDYVAPKLPRRERKPNRKISDLEKNFECPLCLKRFLTASAMNGHVAKLHRTTLGDKYVCHLCGAPGSSRSSLKRHLIRTHKVAQVEHPELLTKKCPHCKEGFAGLTLLYDHVRSIHADQVHIYYECKFCPALIRSKASFLRHVKRAHPGEEDLFTAVEMCSVCDHPFTNLHLLQKHKKEQHPELRRHRCNLCDLIFKYPSMLSRHMQLIHENPAKYREILAKRKMAYTCEYCNRKFNSKIRITTHIKNIHTNPPEDRIYSCRLCGMTFATAKLNNKHYRRVHRPERQKIHCGKCNITFESREECDRHRAIHPATCSVCQKQFLRRDSLREHLLIHSAPRHQCPHCNKKFTQRSNLKRHIRVHTGEKPYTCDYCNRGFSDKSACNSHVRVHTGYERSVCTICGVSFSKKQRLNYHMRIHSGQGLLHCPLCQRPCTSSYSFRKHVESHQVFLTKSLRIMDLLPPYPDFVDNILQSLIQVTLDENGHKTRDTRPFLGKKHLTKLPITRLHSVSLGLISEDDDDSKERVKTYPQNDSSEAPDFEAAESFEKSPSDLIIKAELKVEEGESTLNFNGSLSEENAAENTGDELGVVRLFQSLIEKEATRTACMKKRIRKKKLKITDRDDVIHAADNMDDDDDENSYEGSIAQCLEIVMSDEDEDKERMENQSSDDDDDDESSLPPSDRLLNVDEIKLETDFVYSEQLALQSPYGGDESPDSINERLRRENDAEEPNFRNMNDKSNISLELQTSMNHSERFQSDVKFESKDSENESEILKIPKLKISRNQNEFVVNFINDSS